MDKIEGANRHAVCADGWRNGAIVIVVDAGLTKDRPLLAIGLGFWQEDGEKEKETAYVYIERGGSSFFRHRGRRRVGHCVVRYLHIPYFIPWSFVPPLSSLFTFLPPSSPSFLLYLSSSFLYLSFLFPPFSATAPALLLLFSCCSAPSISLLFSPYFTAPPLHRHTQTHLCTLTSTTTTDPLSQTPTNNTDSLLFFPSLVAPFNLVFYLP